MYSFEEERMKRIEEVYKLVKAISEGLDEEDLTLASGVTTKEVAERLNIQRSNASKDLNELVREGVIDKLPGRPVRYICKSVFRHKPLSKYVESYREQPESRDAKKKTGTMLSDIGSMTEDIFNQVIGTTASMKNSVEQAKASILYPPRGLNCLIIGPTGSGKTYFAHTMFQFAKQHHVVEAEKEMIVFNCADYASNPELLMSHLFGHAKGAFTGADEEKEGLISLANDSFLFLDEVHRLPPEGQEMVFYFMDNGTYARLGETTKSHKANVRIICATTEDTSSSLLNTFMRRIPITIQLPNFETRTAKEKIDLLRLMMTMESKRIQRKIILSEDVVKALIGSVSYGNVGQLKSNVQLVTAQSFLNFMDQEELHITLEDLNPSIKEGLIHLANNRDVLTELSQQLSPQMVISPNDTFVTFEQDSYELPYNLYEIIGDKAAVLKEDGLSQEAINHFILTDINVHLKSFYRNHGFTFDTESKLSEIIDSHTLATTRLMYDQAKELLAYDFQSNFLYAIGLHLSSFLSRASEGKLSYQDDNDNIKRMVEHYGAELRVAESFKALIEERHSIQVPEEEVHYLAVLLISLRENKAEGRIGIVVAAHGNSTATSMVQVATHLLQVDNIKAVDMPLDMEPKEAFKLIQDEVVSVNEGSGVLLLVDMGSLGTVADDIEKNTRIPIKVLDMVTTATVLEAARKSSSLEANLTDLYESMMSFRGYTFVKETLKEAVPSNHLPKAIVAICASGKGTAQRMKELIDQYLSLHFETDITVFPVSIIDLSSDIKAIQEQYSLIATTGIKDPELDVPFIPMDVLFSNDGDQVIEQLITHQYEASSKEFTMDNGREMCQKYMTDSFTFINPHKVLAPLWLFAEKVTRHFKLETNPLFFVNLTMHMAGAIERELKGDSLDVIASELKEKQGTQAFIELEELVNQLNQTLQLRLSSNEVFYILSIIENEKLK